MVVKQIYLDMSPLKELGYQPMWSDGDTCFIKIDI